MWVKYNLVVFVNKYEGGDFFMFRDVLDFDLFVFCIIGKIFFIWCKGEGLYFFLVFFEGM